MKYFLTEFCKENRIESRTLGQSAIEKLTAHNFPGNVRELKALIELSAVMCEGEEIMASEININAIEGSIDRLMEQDRTLKDYNTMIVQHFMDKHNKNVLKVARILGVGKSTIYRMIQSHEIYA